MLNRAKAYLKRYLSYPLGLYRKRLYLLAVATWPTKSYEVWLFIQYLLYESRPNTVLELGSGRSTHYFSEYCYKKNAQLISIEQNKRYVRKNIRGLNNSFLPSSGIYHVPIKEDWFDIDALDRVIAGRTADFLLIDAPGGGGGGIRNSVSGNNFLKAKTKTAKVIIVDDFHRQEVRSSVKKILLHREGAYIPLILKYTIYNSQNQILFLVSPELEGKANNFLKLLNIEFASAPE